jgi:hypothetical protein
MTTTLAPFTPAPGGYLGGDRDSVVAEALARLAVAVELRHTSAAARVLDGLAGTEAGAWLLTQMAAAGLRALSTGIQTLPLAAAADDQVLTSGYRHHVGNTDADPA